MDKKDNFKGSYKLEKAPSVKDILVDENWRIEDVVFNGKTGKYDFKATHANGREVELSRNRQYVDNLLDELENDK